MSKPYAMKCLVTWGFAFLMLAGAHVVAAHPLGNLTISHYARLTIGSEHIRVRYVVDMAEIATFQEFEVVDTNDDHMLAKEEYDTYVARVARQYAENFLLTIDGVRVPLQVEARQLATLPGDGGLPVLRVTCDLAGNVPPGSAGRVRRLHAEDTNRRERSGWRELVVTPEAGVSIFDSTAFANGITDELKAYPQDMLTAPLGERIAALSFISGAPPAGAQPLRTRDGRPIASRPRDRLAALIAVPELSFHGALLGWLIAVALGGLHALSPGHGKTVVGAYLVGSRGTARHAAFLGATVTITHTMGIFALGLVTLFGAQHIVPERLFPLLSMVSGLTVLGIGLQQLMRRLRVAFGYAQYRHVHHHHDDADHSHRHAHDDHVHTHHDHPHHYPHSHHYAPDHHGHAHLPPAQITWRSLLALGISGGLLPCPSALVVLLSAISLHRIGYGLLLVLAFSIGLAGVLTGIGLAFIHARRFLEHPMWVHSGALIRALPVVSALVITCAGALICYQAFVQGGIQGISVAAAAYAMLNL
jgi:ABC-type nickel/cobalt efflux system permease component RcnA